MICERSTAERPRRERLIANLNRLDGSRRLWGDDGGSPRDHLCDAVRTAVATSLTSKQREVVEAYFFEGLSQGEIAGRLGITQQVVQKRLYGAQRHGRLVGGAIARLRDVLSLPSSRRPPALRDHEHRTLRRHPRAHRRRGCAPHVRGGREAVFHREAPRGEARTARSRRGQAHAVPPADLPSNGEIRDALLALAEQLAEGSRRTRRLFAMRVVALEAMRAIASFEPRLIGSVSTGHIRRGSDVDLQVFTPDEDRLEARLRELDWTFERERVTIQKFGEIREYLHFHVVDAFPIELTVYEPRELRFRPKSSTDGKPIVRVKAVALEAMLAREHADAWARYLADGTIEGLEESIGDDDDDAPRPGAFDSLLSDGSDDDMILPEPGEEEDPEQLYEPLPGFERTG